MGCFMSIPRIRIHVEVKKRKPKDDFRSTFATVNSTEISANSLEPGREEAIRSLGKCRERKYIKEMDGMTEEKLNEEEEAVREYIDRFISPMMKPNDSSVEENKKRKNLSLGSKVMDRSQVYGDTSSVGPVREVRGAPIVIDSQIHSRIASFEEIDQQSRKQVGPTIEELRKRNRENRLSACERWKSLPITLYTM